MQKSTKKCNVNLERLPVQKVEIKSETSSQEILNSDEIKIEEHNDLDSVSNSTFYGCILKNI